MDNTNGFNQPSDFENDFSPLNENVVQRDYTRPNVQGNIDSSPIEEAVVIPPSFEDLNQSFQQNLGGEQQEQMQQEDTRKVWGSENPMSSGNPYVEELDNKDKKKAAEMMSETIIDGYAKVWAFGERVVKINPNKVEKLMRNGEIHPDLVLPVQGQQMWIMDYIQEYNSQIDGIFTVSEDFRTTVKPILTRVLMKRNVGMTDEQALLYHVAMDSGTKLVMGYNAYSQQKEMLSIWKDMSLQGAYTNTPQRPTPQEEAPKQAQPKAQEEAPQPTREYIEPDEVKREPVVEYAEVEVVEPKKTTKEKGTTMPDFGNESILQQMEDIAKKDRLRKRPRK